MACRYLVVKIGVRCTTAGHGVVINRIAGVSSEGLIGTIVLRKRRSVCRRSLAVGMLVIVQDSPKKRPSISQDAAES